VNPTLIVAAEQLLTPAGKYSYVKEIPLQGSRRLIDSILGPTAFLSLAKIAVQTLEVGASTYEGYGSRAK
jgi:hypothetical protein